MTTIRAVPKTYAGVGFRSTLEADWAYNLDRFGIVWQYEPEAVRLPSEVYYRPDFYLPELTTWLEVKGPHDERIEKTRELAESAMHHADGREHDERGNCCWGYPWRLTVIGRASTRGKMTWESPLPYWEVQLSACSGCSRVYFREELGGWSCRNCGLQGEACYEGVIPGYQIVSTSRFRKNRTVGNMESGEPEFKRLSWLK